MAVDSVVAGGVVVVALGAFKLVQFIIARQANGKRQSVPSIVDHGPCNVAVEKLCAVVERSVEEQREFRLAFEKWMSHEEGRRDAMSRTGEFPVASVR